MDLPFLAEHELPESMRREGKALDGQDPSVPSASGLYASKVPKYWRILSCTAPIFPCNMNVGE